MWSLIFSRFLGVERCESLFSFLYRMIKTRVVFQWWSLLTAQFLHTVCERRGRISGVKLSCMRTFSVENGFNSSWCVVVTQQHKIRSNNQTTLSTCGVICTFSSKFSYVDVFENVVISFALLCVWTQHAYTFPVKTPVCWTKSLLWTWKLLSVRIYSHPHIFFWFSEQTGLLRPKLSTPQTNTAAKNFLKRFKSACFTVLGQFSLFFIVFYCLSWKITIRKSKCYF